MAASPAPADRQPDDDAEAAALREKLRASGQTRREAANRVRAAASMAIASTPLIGAPTMPPAVPKPARFAKAALHPHPYARADAPAERGPDLTESMELHMDAHEAGRARSDAYRRAKRSAEAVCEQTSTTCFDPTKVEELRKAARSAPGATSPTPAEGAPKPPQE